MKKTISIVLVVGLIVGLIIYFLPSTKIDNTYLNKIDSLNSHLVSLEKKQDSLNQDIRGYKTQIQEVDNSIQTIKNQKTVVKEYYHEKIISIDGFSRNDIDTFFANRYGYNR